jgi:hypothetical protein
MEADSFHRLAKALLDSGEAATVQEALDTFAAYGVRVRLAADIATDLTSQVIALTVINSAARSFQGNVLVEATDFELTAPGFAGMRLHEFLSWAQVSSQGNAVTPQWPVIEVGAGTGDAGAIRPWADGWDFGVGAGRKDRQFFAPTCVAAAGLAVSEAFSILRGDNPYAGRRELYLSTWLGSERAGPVPACIGAGGLWVVGLGHLGQAYAWTLGFTNPSGAAPHVLQDVDVITKSTLSTSMLSKHESIGTKKTRVVARWLEARGFHTALVERRFDEHQRVAAGEPTVALFGVDNPAARRSLESAGFRLVVDAGLGAGYRDFGAMRLRTFPGASNAADLWATPAHAAASEPQLARAYRDLLAKGADPCGVTTLATRAVGAPFVGCVAAGYVLAEVARREQGGAGTGFINLNLRDPQRQEVGF